MQKQDEILHRPEAKFARRHHLFLLKELHFTQQFSHLYYSRLAQLLDSVKANAVKEFGASAGQKTRILALKEGQRCVVIGTVYKQMQKYVPFLKEYTKELVRIAEGAEGDGDEEGEDGDVVVDEDTNNNNGSAESPDPDAIPTGGPLVSTNDFLILEDESGRIELTGSAAPPPASIVTGVVIGVYGLLKEKGKFEVEKYCFAGGGGTTSVPRPLIATAAETERKPLPPVYVGFVSGLSITASGMCSPSMETLVNFISGNLGDAGAVREAACIARLIIGGNLVDSTDDTKLKAKVKLDPSDHQKVTGANVLQSNTAANAMRHADALLESLARTVEVDVMPGDTDPTNCFLPQQPIHPVLLRRSSKLSTLRLVTNPYMVDVSTVESQQQQQTTLLVSSGQGVADVMRQSDLQPLQVLEKTIGEWACMFPTAPNTLPCYPFRDSDPFLLINQGGTTSASSSTTATAIPPHLVVACNQAQFDTSFKNGTRYITVPTFSEIPQLILVDLHSPELEPKVVDLAA